jgi:signal transduction histidine kinase
MNADLFTEFAPAERLSIDAIRVQAAAFSADMLSVKILDAIPDIVLVLNHQRQVIYTNQALFKGLNQNRDRALGFRPGELLDCAHADEHKGGCGTTQFCSVCGAVKAILASQKGFNESQECHLIQHNGDALDLRVWASPLEINGESYTIFTISDISHEKRRQVLERIFFHDLLNTTSSLVYTAQMLKESDPLQTGELVKMIGKIANTLNDEIQAQRTLSAAEENELSVLIAQVQVSELLHEITEIFAANMLAKERKISTCFDIESITITTDRVLLRRVISNMVKNALEGCWPGETVTIGCRRVKDEVRIWVHNPGSMSHQEQLQVFQRSFTTKGPGRGLGTYSIKLLTERYLKGKIAFSSTEEGVRFEVTLPLTYR